MFQMQLSRLLLLALFCCSIVLSHEVMNYAKANWLVNLKLPMDQVGLAVQPFGYHQPTELWMLALYHDF